MLINQSILSTDFIINTATTVSAIYKLEYYYKYWPTKKSVIWGKAKAIEVNYEGIIVLRSNTGYIYILKNILYMPELGINILSTHRLGDMVSTFYKDRAYIYTKDIYTNPSIYRPKDLNLSNLSTRTTSRTTIFTATK